MFSDYLKGVYMNKKRFLISLCLFILMTACVSLPRSSQILTHEELTSYPKEFEIDFEKRFQKFYYINLDLPGTSADRKKEMEDYFRSDFSQLERFPGVIGSQLVFSEKDSNGVQRVTLPSGRILPHKPTCLNKLTPGELGCAMSHYLVWEKISKDPEKNHIYLVAEDDIIPKSDFKKRLISSVYNAPKDWGMIFLFSYQSKWWGCHHSNVDVIESKRFLNLNKRCIPGGVAYLITPESAKKVMENVLPFRNAIDRMVRDDLIIRRGVKVFAAYPEMLSTREDSVIDEVDGGRKR